MKLIIIYQKISKIIIKFYLVFNNLKLLHYKYSMNQLLEKTKIYFLFDDETIIYYLKKYNEHYLEKDTIIFDYFYKILLNKIYNYINYYGIIYEIKNIKNIYEVSDLYKKTNQTLYKKLFDENILLKENLDINNIIFLLKDYIQEIIYCRILINSIIEYYKNNLNEFENINLSEYIKLIESKYFNREEPEYSFYNEKLNFFSNLF